MIESLDIQELNDTLVAIGLKLWNIPASSLLPYYKDEKGELCTSSPLLLYLLETAQLENQTEVVYPKSESEVQKSNVLGMNPKHPWREILPDRLTSTNGGSSNGTGDTDF